MAAARTAFVYVGDSTILLSAFGSGINPTTLGAAEQAVRGAAGRRPAGAEWRRVRPNFWFGGTSGDVGSGPPGRESGGCRLKTHSPPGFCEA
jgi:hypothetical protein